ncbi:MAG: ComEC/Rec2 family competence protein [Bacteroidales bacterium]|nr:ComEC/Rec2 family competence protein [Bacteroidales bacterium]
MLYKKTPFTSYCIALATGIICGQYLHSVAYCNVALILLSLFLTVNILFFSKLISSLPFGLILHGCIFLCGCSLAFMDKQNPVAISKGQHEFLIKTEAYPEKKPRSVMLQSSIISVDGNKYSKNNRLLVYTDSKLISDSLKPGSILSFRASPREIIDFDSTDNFDYRAYMNRKGYKYLCFCYDTIDYMGYKPGIRQLGTILRESLFLRLDSSLDNRKSLAIVSAITLGNRALLDNEIKDEFRKSGIIHILAVSGLHVGIISLITISLLRMAGLRSGLLKLSISLLVIWSYALISGLSPSVTRAAVMFSFLNTGYYINRPATALNSVMASAFIIMLAKPSIIFEASFLLSYSAVIFIVCNYRELSGKIRFRGRIMSWLWNMVAVSLLAQAGSISFVALFFGEVPLFSVLSSLFAIPLATLILSAGLALIILSSVPVISKLIANILVYCVNTLTDAASATASLPAAVIRVNDISAPAAVLLFLVLFATTRFILAKEKRNPHLLLVFAILYFIIRM